MELSQTFTFQLLIDGVDYTGYVLKPGPRIMQADHGEVDTMAVELEDTDNTLVFDGLLWREVKFQTTTGVILFGGYLVDARPQYYKALDREVWQLRCESYATLINHGPVIRASYANKTAKYILQDLFRLAGLGMFDVDTAVATGETLATFVADGESLTGLIDRLAGLANVAGGEAYIWWVTPARVLRFGLASSFPAPFSIEPIATANWVTSFPALKGSLGRWSEYPSLASGGSYAGAASGGGGGRDDYREPIKWF